MDPAIVVRLLSSLALFPFLLFPRGVKHIRIAGGGGIVAKGVVVEADGIIDVGDGPTLALSDSTCGSGDPGICRPARACRAAAGQGSVGSGSPRGSSRAAGSAGAAVGLISAERAVVDIRFFGVAEQSAAKGVAAAAAVAAVAGIGRASGSARSAIR